MSETHRAGTHVPVTGVPVTGVTATTERERERPSTISSRGGRSAEGKELSEGAEHVLHEAKRTGEEIYHNWRQYPKLLTLALLLSSFLLGAVSLGMVRKVGLMGSGGNYVASHWDRNTADAHHALDVILDHLQHPELYETTKHGKGMVTKARGRIGDFLSGIVPSGWGRKGVRGGYGRDRMEDVKGWAQEKTGYGDKGYTGELYEKMGDISRQGMESAKDAGYGIGSKMSEMADVVKHKLSSGGGRDRGVMDIDDHEDESYLTRIKRGVGLGEDREHMQQRRGYSGDEDHEMELATQKLRRVVRQADREL